jgi:uncharacterized repeat protein (TIGR03803 family)
MKRLDFARDALFICAVAAIFSACGQSQSTIVIPAAPSSAVAYRIPAPSSSYRVLHRFAGTSGEYLRACLANVNMSRVALPNAPALVRTAGAQECFQEHILYNFQDYSPYAPIGPASALFRGVDGGLYGAVGDYVVELKRNHSLRIIYYFKERSGGIYPSGLVADAAGNLYGTTFEGGDTRCLGGLGCGTAFELSPSHGSYAMQTLHVFEGGTDGIGPSSLTLGANGALYGETLSGGDYVNCSFGCGTVFRLTAKRGHYDEAILYRFAGGSDGSMPRGSVLLNARDDVFGVTGNGGESCPDNKMGCGTVYELVRHRSAYAERILYRFRGGASRPAVPTSIVRTGDGVLYGATVWGGNPACQHGCGTIFQLVSSGSKYVLTILTRFGPAPGKAARGPSQPLIWNNELYGTTAVGGNCSGGSMFSHGCGTAFVLNLRTRLTRVIHDFDGAPNDGTLPTGGGLIAGSDGSLYGATAAGGTGECFDFTGCGTFYRLSR